MEFIRKLALKLHRTPDETRQLDAPSNVRANFALFTGVCASLLLLAVPACLEQLARWDNRDLFIKLPTDAWHLLAHTTHEPCAFDATTSKNCPANPANATLFASPLLRTSDQGGKLRESWRGREYWVGTTVPVETLRKAYALRANHFVLGWVRTRYNVWIDGQYVRTGDRRDTEAMIFDLSMVRLAQNKPLTIAIQLYHDADHFYPDALNGIRSEGFTSYARANLYKSYSAFFEKMRPFASMLASFMLSLLLFMFWASTRTKQEYFYMSLYALMSTLFAARQLESFYTYLNVSTLYTVDIAIRFSEATFALFAGFSFARLKRGFFAYGIPICLAAPWIATLGFLETANAKYLFIGWMGTWVTPTFFALGALACFLQAAHLGFSARSVSSRRARRLVLFGVMLALLGCQAYIVTHNIGTTYHSITWQRLIQLALLYALAFVVLADYHDQEEHVERAPISEYHRRPVLPAKISGAVLVADFKQSEAFYRARAARRSSENPVSAWRANCYAAILRAGGTVLDKKGDEVLGFFDNAKCADPVAAAVSTFIEMSSSAETLSQELLSSGNMPTGVDAIRFRAAITTGDVCPVWEVLSDNRREPFWEETETSKPMTEAALLLELERQAPESARNTYLVVEETTTAPDQVDSIHAVATGLRLKDKNGRSRSINVFTRASAARKAAA